MAEDPAALRARARHYRLLAAGITDSALVSILHRMAGEFDAAADAADAAPSPPALPRAE